MFIYPVKAKKVTKAHYVKSPMFVQKVDFNKTLLDFFYICKIQPNLISKKKVTLVSDFRWFFMTKIQILTQK